LFPIIQLPFQTMLLAMEAQSVRSKTDQTGRGGPAAMAEGGEMVTEKFVALAEATGTIMTGGSLRMVVTRYRALVKAKELRLAK
jgi:hypothetical protein